MKQETVVLFAKAACYAVIGGLTPLASGLGQWANEPDASPSTVNWVIILSGCGVGCASQLLSFLSQSYGTWKAERSAGNGTTTITK